MLLRPTTLPRAPRLLAPTTVRALTLASHAYLPPKPTFGPPPTAGAGAGAGPNAGPNAPSPPNAPASSIPHTSVASSPSPSPPSLASAPYSAAGAGAGTGAGAGAGANPDDTLKAAAATTESPELSESERRLIEEIVRVDHAGELGANWIYRGQKWACQIRGDRETAGQVEGMWDNERHHLNVLTRVAAQHRVRPTALYPAWQGLAWGMGAVTALMGKEAAMACTEAVETVIGEHYDDQLRALRPLLSKPDAHPSLPLLAKVLEEFRDDELAHLDTAVEEGALKAPGHSLLSAVVGAACRVGIAVAQKV